MDRKSSKAVVLTALIVVVLAACKKDKPAGSNSTPTPTAAKNVYVVCEGSLGQGNASLYVYQPAKDSAYGDVYSAVNHQPLGDVFQSVKAIGSNLFLCVNNSDKIVVVNASTWQLAGVITVPKPRYIVPVSATKAFVSSLFDRNVYVIDPATMQVTDTIATPGENTEGMFLNGNDLFVCTWDTSDNHVYVIDATTNQLTDSIRLNGYGAQDIVKDKNQQLWVMAGDQPDGRTATLSRIDPVARQVTETLNFPATADPIRPVINNTGDTIYYIDANVYGGTQDNGIYRMSIDATNVPTQAFIPAQQYQYFWALGIDPQTGNVYVGDPKGFIQQGSVYIYNPSGTLLHQFTTGVGPGHFLFD